MVQALHVILDIISTLLVVPVCLMQALQIQGSLLLHMKLAAHAAGGMANIPVR